MVRPFLYLLTILVITVAVYAAGAFIAWSADPADWDELLRGLAAVVYAVWIGLALNEDDDDADEE